VIKRKASRVGPALGLGLVVLAVFALRASTRPGEERPDADLIAVSDEIFVGVCVETVCRYEPSWKTVVTDARFRVESALKGSLSRFVTVTVPGGEMPDWNLGVLAPEAPRFSTGESRLVFAWTGPDGIRQVAGLSRGARPAEDANEVARQLR